MSESGWFKKRLRGFHLVNSSDDVVELNHDSVL